MNSNIQKSQNLTECPSETNQKYQQTSFKMNSLGNKLYKLSIVDGSQDQNSILKLHFNTESGNKTIQPIVYLDLSNENQNLPKMPSHENGIPESSILTESFNCHGNSSKKFTYGFEFNNLENVSFSPTEYSYQFDVASDLCKNIFQFKPEMNNEVVLTKHVLNQFCYRIDNNQEMLTLSVPVPVQSAIPVIAPKSPETVPVTSDTEQKVGFLGIPKQPTVAPEQKYQSEMNDGAIKLQDEIGNVWANFGKNLKLLKNKLVHSLTTLPVEEKAKITALKSALKEDSISLGTQISEIFAKCATDSAAAGQDSEKIKEIHAEALVDVNNAILAEQKNIQELNNEIKTTKQNEKNEIMKAVIDYKTAKVDLFNETENKTAELSAKASAEQTKLGKKLNALHAPPKSADSDEGSGDEGTDSWEHYIPEQSRGSGDWKKYLDGGENNGSGPNPSN